MQHAPQVADDHPALASWAEVGPGTAYVESVEVLDDATSLRLRYPGGRHLEVRVPEVPRRPRACRPTPVTRALAVRIRHHEAEVECSVLGSSVDGPRRIPISMPVALSLAGSGVHTVVLTD